MLFSSYLSENAKRDGKLPYLTANQKQNGKGHAPQIDYTNFQREGKLYKVPYFDSLSLLFSRRF
jgi:hypothetical protein